MSNIGMALEITALGMGLVFGALILLWGMMTLLTTLTADKQLLSPETFSDPLPPEMGQMTEEALRAQAAAVAVAMAIAEQQTSSVYSLVTPSTAYVSAWQLGMRTRQMYQKGGSMRRQARQENR